MKEARPEDAGAVLEAGNSALRLRRTGAPAGIRHRDP